MAGLIDWSGPERGMAGAARAGGCGAVAAGGCFLPGGGAGAGSQVGGQDRAQHMQQTPGF
ncbi:MAG: hypothetical protein BM562_05610 [Alphaproteobacteria bacterium MedPE-SWcel]|nr:MAG: hypothetical protein BM562_05610 [Alphaproteobacteria bacterium MedPE-SWcel]